MNKAIHKIILCIALSSVLSGCHDEIELANSAGEAGLLVDGQGASGPVSERGYVANSTAVIDFNVGELSNATSPNRNEAISFGEDRAPQRAPMAWTGGDDRFAMNLGDRLSVPVTVWIVQGPFADQRMHAIDACIRTAAIWDAERMGIRFGEFEIRDATSDPDIDDAILNSVGGDTRNWDDFSNDIGFINGRINIYWINTVEGATTWGWSNFGDRIVMGQNTGNDLLSHELGHALSLQHSISCSGTSTNFDNTNMMAQCSDIRGFITEGQVFRAHFNTSSSINSLYNARPGQATVNCIGGTNNAECPNQARRLWDDGIFLAN